jgi:4-hydroxy-3-polyprenylbenzoate decarboxylase
VAVVLGCDPATILGAVTPVPDSLSEYQFAGLLRGGKTELTQCLGSDAAGAGLGRDRAGRRDPSRRDGARRAVRRPHRLLQRAGRIPGVHHRAHHHAQDPIYHSTYTGKPPDEPAVLGVALNEVFVPLLQKQFRKSSISTCRPKAARTAWPSSASRSSTPATPSA